MNAKIGKKVNQEVQRSSLLLPVIAVFTIAVAVAAYALLSGGSEPGGSNSVQRPLVGGDFHALAVDPTNSEKVMVGGHEGAAVSYDGGATWRQISDLAGSDPMGWVIDPQNPSKMYVGGHPATATALGRPARLALTRQWTSPVPSSVRGRTSRSPSPSSS